MNSCVMRYGLVVTNLVISLVLLGTSSALAQNNPNYGGSGGNAGQSNQGNSGNNSGFYGSNGSGPTMCGTPTDYRWRKTLTGGTGLAINANIGNIFGASYELDSTVTVTTAEIRVSLGTYERQYPPVLCSNDAFVWVNSAGKYSARFKQTAETSCDVTQQGSFTGGIGGAQAGTSFSTSCGISVPQLFWEEMCNARSHTLLKWMDCTTDIEQLSPTQGKGLALDFLFEREKDYCRKKTTKEIFQDNLDVFSEFARQFHELVVSEDQRERIDLQELSETLHEREYVSKIIKTIQKRYVLPPKDYSSCFANAKIK